MSNTLFQWCDFKILKFLNKRKMYHISQIKIDDCSITKVLAKYIKEPKKNKSDISVAGRLAILIKEENPILIIPFKET